MSNISQVHRFVTALALLAVHDVCLAQKRAGAIDIVLTDDGRVPVPGASVSMFKTPFLGTASRPGGRGLLPGPNARALVVSEANGRVRASELDPGDYVVCVSVPPERALLSTCKWRGAWKLSVIDGQTATGPVFALQRGGVLRVHLTDNQHFLPNPDSVVMPSFGLGVETAEGKYVGMKTSEQVTGATRHYVMAVPFDTPLRFIIASRRFRFADDSGAELLNGGNVPLTLSRGRPTKDIQVTVIGPR